MLSFIGAITMVFAPTSGLPTISQVMRGAPHEIAQMCFSPDGRTLVLSSNTLEGTSPEICLWDTGTGRLLWRIKPFDKWVFDTAVSPNGESILARDSTSLIRQWNLRTGILQSELKITSPSDVRYSPDGKVICAANDEGELYFWEAKTGRAIRRVKGHDLSILEIAFTPDSKYLASASSDNTIKMWSIDTGDCVRTISEHAKGTVAMSFFPEGGIGIASVNGSLIFRGVLGSETVDRIDTNHRFLCGMYVSASGNIVVTFESQSPVHIGTVDIWDVKSRSRLGQFKKQRLFLEGIAMVANGRMLVLADRKTLILWDVASSSEVGRIDGHRSSVTCLAASGNGMCLASATRNGTIRLWDVSGE